MSILRTSPKGALVPFGLAAAIFLTTPTRVAYQDIASLLAQQPAVSASWRKHLIASPFGTIHAATFSFRRPIGTDVSEMTGPRVLGNEVNASGASSSGFQLASVNADDAGARYQLASIDPINQDIIGSTRSANTASSVPAVVFPTVNREGKGPFLGKRESTDSRELAPEVMAALPGLQTPEELAAQPASSDSAKAIEELEAATRPAPPSEYDLTLSHEPPAQLTEDTAETAKPRMAVATPAFPDDLDEHDRASRLLFGGAPVGAKFGTIEAWKQGEEPMLVVSRAPFDPDLKRSANLGADAAPNASASGQPEAGESVAGKGQVTGEDKQPMNLAARLGLEGKARAKAERCLADAIYFESRGEPVRGQIAVAQVVMNRVFSGYYPSDVCGVVYQNAHRHLACQFTFACDGIRDTVNDADAWRRATRISKQVLQGKLWLSEIGKSTHYHAYWVHPWWTRSMRKISRIGVHTFYRPHKWGDGHDAPSWGTEASSPTPSKNL